ncbi:hypothetical protein DS831_04825 [Bombilactobacillus bombi]|uniref:Uncharacterized protein n=2 Tax=Bombilactobacillus bombi TaxID=1303590 RepID=A0A347SSG8_9LACO|nr:DUF3284 domain-containing protein [Bombilactobacillus bombi]RHW48755.1 hypothetical protein DS832_00460 [Bombilactobacillus bombi]RHW51348.1 hypothetical protein DS831_04825 [Bombilactobacillus bombi]
MNVAVPVDYFFQRIIESSLYDIKQQTGKKISPNQLRGFTFKRKHANGVVSTMTVTAYQPNQQYAYKMQTGRNDYYVSYNVAAVDEQHMQFTYEEKLQGKSATINANNHASGFLMGWFRKRRFKKMKRQIEADYRKQ